MKYYLIAGEASGDLHGSNLMKELLHADREAEFHFFGGDKMQQVGGHLVKHYREMAFMGFVGVLLNIKTIKRNMKLCKKDLLEFQPDVVILIDYAGFNLHIAEFAQKHNMKVFYYISPKVWAWKEYRVKKLKTFVNQLFTILPFETEFFKNHGIDVCYVGNPLLDSVAEFRKAAKTKEQFLQENHLDNRPVVALLSGSRVREIKKILPVMAAVTEGFPDFQFVVAGISSIDEALYGSILGDKNIPVLFNQTYDLLNYSHAALVASGTATLETALFNVPQAVLYRTGGGWLMQVFMKLLLKVKWVSLPNLILNEGALKEFIQVEMTVPKVKSELRKILIDETRRNELLNAYNRLNERMGEAGSSKRAATEMIELLRNPKTLNFGR